MIAKILIASTLKPVSDTRGYYKIAKSLAKSGKYIVEIIGGPPRPKIELDNIKLHPQPLYSRNLISRLQLRWKIFGKIIRIRPDLLIITSHELLVIAAVYRLLYRKKIIYDIQENYNFNLRFQQVYPWGFRHLLALAIRCKEIICSPFIAYFFLAEKCYQQEIKFLSRKKTLVLENKFAPIKTTPKKKDQTKIEFLLSGTIGELYGAVDALNFIASFPADKYLLRIIGHCPDEQLRLKIEEISRCANVS